MNHICAPGQENASPDVGLYLADSTIQTPQGFETSSPALPLDFPESLKDTQVQAPPRRPKLPACGGALLVDLPLVLDDHVLLVDGLQQSRGQRLQVRDGLRGDG